MSIREEYSIPYKSIQVNYYKIEIVTWNHKILYKLLVFDENTWRHIYIYQPLHSENMAQGQFLNRV